MRRDRDLEPARGPASLLRYGVVAGVAVGVLLGCGTPPPPAPTAEPGQPLPGLSREQHARFQAGLGLFNAVFGPERGLGPTFNENQCSACHTSPAAGGFGGERVLRASRFDPASGCDVMADQGGGNIRRKVTATADEAGVVREQVPAGGVEGRFTAPPLYGVGLLAAVADASIEALADPDDRDGDGISGRVGRLPDGRLARFGRKADVVTLAEFVALAAHQEMGLTSAGHPEDRVSGRAPAAADPAPDPELDDAAIGVLTAFLELLAPPGRGLPPAGWTDADVARGEATFSRIGCARCHTPTLPTAPAAPAPLGGVSVALYSDLLLHDLGQALADVCSATATPAELRTEPLLGLRFRDLLMHDGRTTDVAAAIRLHGGEAEAIRRNFEGLAERERAELLAFLRTL